MSGPRSNIQRILELYTHAITAEGAELEAVVSQLREAIKEEGPAVVKECQALAIDGYSEGI